MFASIIYRRADEGPFPAEASFARMENYFIERGVWMVDLTIDGQKVAAAEGTTILKAAESAGIKIPTLCYHKRLNPLGSCRMSRVFPIP
jgi:hypothetical protein